MSSTQEYAIISTNDCSLAYIGIKSGNAHFRLFFVAVWGVEEKKDSGVLDLKSKQ